MSFFWKRARALAQLGCAASLLSLLSSTASAQQTAAASTPLTAAAQVNFSAQFQAFQAEKAALTPAQRKLSTPLAMAIPAKKARVSRSFSAFRGFAAAGADGRSDVVITARVTPALLAAIARAGGEVLSIVASENAVRVLISPAGAEQVAALDEVKFIRLYVAPLTKAGPTSTEGDVAHAAAPSRDLYKLSGSGIRVGVISDGVASLASSQRSGELPAKVTVIKNESGTVQRGDGDEGTAMLEIVHDLAPGAQLYFATGGGGQEVMADNIRGLRKAGCDIIVDDLLYPDEGVYQDDIIARAVNDVVKDGALFFSATGNYGNLDSGTSSTWEGQFRAGDTISTTKGTATMHLWDGAASNPVEMNESTTALAILQWADPLTASTNDYDLYALDDTGAIVSASQDVQAGDSNAYESVNCRDGNRLVAVLLGGEPRPLHLAVLPTGTLTFATSGSTYGHSAAGSTIGVAAVAARGATTAFTRANPIELFSSDGYRTFYFDAAGNKRTFVVKTPQLAAADGIVTSVPGFTRFYGTSAAAPHAAAIAALVWSFDRSRTGQQVKDILYTTAIDIMGKGFDRNSGYGITMVDRALAKIGPPLLSHAVLNIRATEGDKDLKNVRVTLVLSKASNANVTVNYATKSGTAKADIDFQAKVGTLTIPKGATKVDLFFAIKGDKIVEADETFQIAFSKSSVPFKGESIVTVNILNDDTALPAPVAASSPTS